MFIASRLVLLGDFAGPFCKNRPEREGIVWKFGLFILY